MEPSISIIIPALNEENNIEPTVESVISVTHNKFSDYEIIIFDDASTDNTLVKVNEIAVKNNRIKVIHNEKTMGLGYNYKKGVFIAKNEYVIMVPGDNEIEENSIKTMFDSIGKTDIVTSYSVNYWIRPFSRQIISKIFTNLMNTLFNLNLKYYNGISVHKRELINQVQMTTYGFAYHAEILVRLIKSGYSFTEVGIYLKKREYGASKAFSLKNIVSVLKTIARLLIDLYIKNKNVKK